MPPGRQSGHRRQLRAQPPAALGRRLERFFEQNSHVEAILREDPSGVYPRQDFATSDRYRRVVEMIARGSKADEIEVARRAVELAAARPRWFERAARPRWLLPDRSRPERAEGGLRLPARLWRERAAGLGPRPCRMRSISGRSRSGLVALTALVIVARAGRSCAWWWVLVLAAVVLLPLVRAGGGHGQPGVDPVPAAARAAQARLQGWDPARRMRRSSSSRRCWPAPASAAALLERLEIHYLANPDPHLRFALLTDFADAAAETMPQDEGLVDDALERVQAPEPAVRRRRRGHVLPLPSPAALEPGPGLLDGLGTQARQALEFNRLLRGARDTSYAVLSADPASLAADPLRDHARRRHPDAARHGRPAGRNAGPSAQPAAVRSGRSGWSTGYGVLQPRISFHLTAATHSRFAALLATSGGIDPYSTAASDTYMDLFGEGSFTGKGIYDVDAFEAATGTTFPENHILSHDLIEGNYARCGLLSDTELFDDFPARYHAYARREHRWVRGDWQLLPWLGRRVPTAEGWRPNPLPLLERWKLLDNLRRSLVPPALVVLLMLGWTVLPGSPWLWTAVALAILAVPFFQSLWAASSTAFAAGRCRALIYWALRAPGHDRPGLLDIAFLAIGARFWSTRSARTLVRLS